MTVGELIKQLSQWPDNYLVVVEGTGNDLQNVDFQSGRIDKNGDAINEIVLNDYDG